MKDVKTVILVPIILLFSAAVFIYSGAWARLIKLIPRRVREFTRRQSEWVLWAAFFIGLFLLGFSLAAIIKW